MSHFAITGLSSGIDFASLTTKIIESERRPIDLMESKQEEFQDQLGTWNMIRGKISELENTVNSMKTLSDLSPMSDSFVNNNSDDNRQTVSVLATGVTEDQDYEITVNQLAKNHRIMSGGVESGEALSQGTFTVTIGGVSTDFSIVLDGENDTLEELRNSINNAGIGVTASVIDDGSSEDPFRLLLTADDVGSANQITINHDTVPFQVMGSSVVSGVDLGSFEELQAARDAEINFGGQIITRTSNTIDDLIDNTTIQLHNAGSGTLSFASDTASLKDMIVNFVEVHNETKLFIEKQINYNTETKEKGLLFGDSTLINLISTFNAFTSDAITDLTGNYFSLPDIGITTRKEDGTLTIDYTKLDESLADDYEAVANLFVASGTTSTSDLSFIDHTKDTASGTYTVYFTGTDASGNVEGYFEGSDGSIYTATGSGRFLTGSGSAAGLIVRINDDASSGGSVGTVSLSLGVAEKFSTEIYNLNTFDGRFYLKTTYLEDLIDENAEKIQFQLDLLDRREIELKRRFADLEGAIGAMQAQSQFLTGQLDRLSTGYAKK